MIGLWNVTVDEVSINERDHKIVLTVDRGFVGGATLEFTVDEWFEFARKCAEYKPNLSAPSSAGESEE